MFGMKGESQPPATSLLKEGDTLTLGETVFTAWATPGHSPGSMCFVCRDEGLVIAGDTMFCGGQGRTDLWGGDHAKLMASLSRLRTLPKETRVITGHGPETTIKRESR